MEFYISLFADLKDRGLTDCTYLDKNLIHFCFMALIQVSAATGKVGDSNAWAYTVLYWSNNVTAASHTFLY